jgi:uncharacterized protein YggE
MLLVRTVLVAGCCILSLLMPAASFAADGIRATFVATRKLTADQIVVTFEQSELYNSDGTSQRSNPGKVIADAFVAAGLDVQSYRSLTQGLSPGFNSPTFNRVADGAVAPAGYDFRRSYTFTLTGFKHPEVILHVLARNGVRQTQSFRIESTKLEATRAELAIEAVNGALQKARAIASQIGLPDLQIVDVAVVGAGPGYAPANMGYIFGDDRRPVLSSDSGALSGAIEVSNTQQSGPIVEVIVAATVTLGARRSP